MTRSLLGKYGHAALLLLIVGVAAWPFLAQAGLPRETDAELHVFRLAELARLISGGEFYPRWAPNFYFGYGYPIFNYYAPLAYYLALPLALLDGIGPVAATKAVFMVTYLVGAAGIFGLVTEWWGRNAAFVAATAYVLSPYIQYVDPLARGDLAEFLSFGLFPLALWAYSRLNRKPTARAFGAAVLATAGVILSHNLMALVFFALLCAWVVWQGVINFWEERYQNNAGAFSGWLKRRAVWLGFALVLGVTASAFFWLPVALEQDAVNLSTLIGDGSHFDFRNHFLTVADLFGPTQWLDWGATEPEFTRNLGMVQWLLAVLGAGGILTGFAPHRRQVLFYALCAFVLIFMMNKASTAVWQTVPMMPYLQFPWRLLGPSAAMLAILGGAGVRALSNCLAQIDARRPLYEGKESTGTASRRSVNLARNARAWIPAVASLSLLLQSLPLTMAPPWSAAAWDTSASAVTGIERQGRWLGTTSTADFVPRTVEVLPSPERSMIEQLLAGETPDRVNRATLPQDTEVESKVIRPLHTRYLVNSATPFSLRLFQFDFPGWRAQIDGVAVDTVLGRPEGFIVVPVPPGEHTIDLIFRDTPARQMAWLVSITGMALTLVLAVRLSVRRRPVGHEPYLSEAKLPRQGLTSGYYASVLRLVATLAAFLILFAVAQMSGLFHHRSQGWTAIPAQVDRFADLGGQIALIGFDSPREVRHGDVLDVTLYWKAQQELDINYQVFLHLLDDSGIPVTQSDKLNPGDFPTRRWPTDKYVRDAHQLIVPESLEPGQYLLSTGLWVRDEGWRLPVLDEDGAQIADSVTLVEITVR